MLKQILLKIKTYIPTYWPLQSFIAVNPLYGRTSKTFDECIADISQYIKINGALNLEYYHQAYANGEISLNSLDGAVKEFLQDKNIFSDHNHNILLDLLTNAQTQSSPEEEIHNNFNPVNILISDEVEKQPNYLENKKVATLVAKFMADFFDTGQAKWSMPIKNNNLYESWLDYSSVGNKYLRSAIKEVRSMDPINSIEHLFSKLQVPGDYMEPYLITIVFKIIGWCGFVKWLEERPDNPYIHKTAQIQDVLAMWLVLEYALHLEYGCTFTLTQNIDHSNHIIRPKTLKQKLAHCEGLYNVLTTINIKIIWQRSIEIEYKSDILNKIKSVDLKPDVPPNDNNHPKSQMVFCIDTRSEGIRRKLEYIDNHQTFGFAGFFGVGFLLQDEETKACSLQCPAIVKPEVALVNKSNGINTPNPFTNLKKSLYKLLSRAKSTFFAPLVLFDIVGMYFSVSLIFKTLFPNKLSKVFKTQQNTIYSNKSIDVFDKLHGFTPVDIAKNANFVLKAIGLINNFAPFVIIAGHIAQSDNNPFQSSLDCGACGGNGGIPNSIAFCQGLNNHEVRKILCEEHDINIPQEIFFVSCCHNTTVDKFDYYNLEGMNQSQHKSFIAIMNDINLACDLLRTERLSSLYGDKDVNIRKSNWAELIPEMALANNAAFIIAPRKITKNINLDRRTFLHSYEPSLDPDGEILSFIFNAPVIVGHWINSQYYFSTTDKCIYGAGNKAIHNVLGEFGVIKGNFSDLKMGLPDQSIFYRDKLMHKPLRLTVFVYAPKKLVEKIINNSPQLKDLFDGRWMHLEVLDSGEEESIQAVS